MRLEFFLLAVVGAMAWAGIELLRDRRRRPQIMIAPDGVSVRDRGTTTAVKWNDIRQIDIMIKGCSYWCIVLLGNAVLEIWDTYRGFGTFAQEIRRRWPEIEPHWKRLVETEGETRTTVWQRGA